MRDWDPIVLESNSSLEILTSKERRRKWLDNDCQSSRRMRRLVHSLQGWLLDKKEREK